MIFTYTGLLSMGVPIEKLNRMKFFKFIDFNKLRLPKRAPQLDCGLRQPWFMTNIFCRFVGTDRRVVLVLLTLLMATAVTAGAAEDSGLIVGEIEIDSRNIFSPGEIENTNGVLRVMRKTMNGVNFNTHHYVLRRELLFKPGEPYVESRLAETERNLRRLGYLNEVQVTAVDTTADGKVNIRVSARETWTLRTSFSFSVASGDNQRWNLSLSDKNFLGHGVTLGAGLGQDENASYWNLWFRQQRLLGTGLRLGLDYSKRQDGYLRQLFSSVELWRKHFGISVQLLT